MKPGVVPASSVTATTTAPAATTIISTRKASASLRKGLRRSGARQMM